jgi:PhnB protein
MTWSAKLAPWLSVADAGRAVDFYRSAFGAVEPERLEGATSGFSRSRGWGSRGGLLGPVRPRRQPAHPRRQPAVRIILTVDDPDARRVQKS